MLRMTRRRRVRGTAGRHDGHRALYVRWRRLATWTRQRQPTPLSSTTPTNMVSESRTSSEPFT